MHFNNDIIYVSSELFYREQVKDAALALNVLSFLFTNFLLKPLSAETLLNSIIFRNKLLEKVFTVFKNN